MYYYAHLVYIRPLKIRTQHQIRFQEYLRTIPFKKEKRSMQKEYKHFVIAE